MTDKYTGPEIAALKLRDRVLRIVGLIRCHASTDILAREWNLIHEAHDGLRDALEKKVSEE